MTFRGFMNMCKNAGHDAYFKQNIFGGEVILGDERVFFTSRRGLKRKKNMFLFNMVKRDVKKYLEKHTLKTLNWSPSVHFNERTFSTKEKIVGFDIDNAYWTIAYQKKIIGNNAYFAGIRTEDKHTMNVSLSSLGTDKYYRQLKRGEVTNVITILPGDDQMKEIYKKIRFTCFNYMKELASILSRYYICYKTDCIYFVKTKYSMRVATDFMEAHDLDFKILHEKDDDLFEGVLS